jgi:hypothetical protein
MYMLHVTTLITINTGKCALRLMQMFYIQIANTCSINCILKCRSLESLPHKAPLDSLYNMC